MGHPDKTATAYWQADFQRAWRLCDDDDRGRRAPIEYVMTPDRTPGRHLERVPPERLRLLSDD